MSDTEHLREFSDVQVGLNRGDREFLFPATLRHIESGRVEAHFSDLRPEQEAQLIQCTFGRADAWLNWQELEVKDRALNGLKDVLHRGLIGYGRLFKWVGNGLNAGAERLVRGKTSSRREWEL